MNSSNMAFLQISFLIVKVKDVGSFSVVESCNASKTGLNNFGRVTNERV
jgi:hypothetical protein